MNWRASPSRRLLARITQCGKVCDGSASMWTCSESYSSRNSHRNTRCWSCHNSQFRCIRMSLKTHMAEGLPLLLCILPKKGTPFVFATLCLLIFLHSSVLLCKLKALSTYVSKMTLEVDAQRFLGCVCLCCWELFKFLILQRVSMSKWTVRLGRWKKRWKHSCWNKVLLARVLTTMRSR